MKISDLFIFVALHLAFTDAIGQSLFSKYIAQNNSYGDILVGGADYYINLNSNTTKIIIKTDTLFNVIWTKEFTPFAELKAIGTDKSLYLVNDDTSIVKSDSVGNILWARRLASPLMQQTLSGYTLSSNIVTGVFPIDDKVLISLIQNDGNPFPNTLEYSSVVALDTSGNYLWSVGDSIGAFRISSIQKSLSGDFWISGNSLNNNITGHSAALIKISANGNILFRRWLPTYFSSALVKGMHSLADSTYYIVTETYNGITGESFSNVMRVNENADVIWNYVYSIDSILVSPVGPHADLATFDDEENIYMIEFGNGKNIFKIDTSGDVVYAKSWNNYPANFEFWSDLSFDGENLVAKVQYDDLGIGLIFPCFVKMDRSGINSCLGLDTSFQVYKYSNSNQLGNDTIWRTKYYLPSLSSSSAIAVLPPIFSDLCIFLSAGEGLTKSDFEIFPIPFSSQITVKFYENKKQVAQLKIFNSIGEVVFEKQIRLEDQTLNLSSLPQGIYLVSVRTEDKIYNQKIIK